MTDPAGIGTDAAERRVATEDRRKYERDVAKVQRDLIAAQDRTIQLLRAELAATSMCMDAVKYLEFMAAVKRKGMTISGEN